MTSRFTADIFVFTGMRSDCFETQSVDDFDPNKERFTTSISRHGYCNLAGPCVKAVPQLLIVFCMSTGRERNCRLWRRPSCDPAVSGVENVVVKDDRLLPGFMRHDRAGYRDVAHFVKDSVGFIHILRCVSTDPFGFSWRSGSFCHTMNKFVPSLAFLFPSLCIAVITRCPSTSCWMSLSPNPLMRASRTMSSV